MGITDQTIKYDDFGRMIYHPKYHTNHKKRFTEEQLMYLCKFWEFDSRRDMSFALGKTEHTLATKVYELKRDDKFNGYKTKYDELLKNN